ncbi:MAG: hypothetical protein AB7W16_10280 [Candidatus Obscuribacterales bacterium]
MIASIVSLVVVAILLIIIDRRTLPGLAAFLYAAGVIAVVVMIGNNTELFRSSAMATAVASAFASAVVYAIAAIIYSFASMGYQNMKRPLDDLIYVGMAVAIPGAAFFFGGLPALLGAISGLALLAAIAYLTDRRFSRS